jgi:hypothetical protein
MAVPRTVWNHHHRNKVSMKIKKLRRKTVILGTIWYVAYASVFLWAGFVLFIYEDSFDSSLGIAFYSLESMNSHQAAALFVYRYVLNFPLSIFNWFTDSMLGLTIFFLIPNAFITRWLLGKILGAASRTPVPKKTL